MEYKDYYKTLGIPRDADELAIKRAYRRLAREHHPDVNQDKAAATERFKAINEAYTVLSDPEKRRRYDSFDSRWSQQAPNGAPRQSWQQQAQRPQWSPPPRSEARSSSSRRRRTATGTIDPEDIERIFRSFGWAYANSGPRTRRSADFSDFFEALFGDLWGAEAGEGRPAWPRGKDVELSAEVSLEEAFHGTTRVLEFGHSPRVEVTVPAGVRNGTRLRLQGLGQRPIFGTAGDLYLDIKILPHNRFTVDGNDLRVTVNVTAEMAAQSGKVKVPTPAKAVWLKIPAGTRDGQVFRLRGLGMPNHLNPAVRGDLFATARVAGTPRRRPAASPALAGLREKLSRWLRPASQSPAVGVGLVGVGLLALTAQFLSGGPVAWVLVLAATLLLSVRALATRSTGWAVAATIALMASLALALTAGLGLVTMVAQAWPLLFLAAGYSVLRGPG